MSCQPCVENETSRHEEWDWNCVRVLTSGQQRTNNHWSKRLFVRSLSHFHPRLSAHQSSDCNHNLGYLSHGVENTEIKLLRFVWQLHKDELRPFFSLRDEPVMRTNTTVHCNKRTFSCCDSFILGRVNKVLQRKSVLFPRKCVDWGGRFDLNLQCVRKEKFILMKSNQASFIAGILFSYFSTSQQKWNLLLMWASIAGFT